MIKSIYFKHLSVNNFIIKRDILVKFTKQFQLCKQVLRRKKMNIVYEDGTSGEMINSAENGIGESNSN